MKKLLIGRHGRCDGNVLDEIGKKQMEDLGRQIKMIIGEGNSVAVYHDSFRHHEQSAKILSDILGTPFYQQEKLLGGFDSAAVLRFIKENEPKFDVVILVCGKGGVESFTQYFLHRKFGHDLYGRIRDFSYGQFCAIDCEHGGSYQMIQGK